MLSSNPTFSLFLVRPFNTKQLTVMITQRLTLQLMVFGEDDLRGHTLMSEFLTLVHPQINPYSNTLHTDVMIRKRDVNTNNGFIEVENASFTPLIFTTTLLKIKSNHHSESSQCREDLTPHGE